MSQPHHPEPARAILLNLLDKPAADEPKHGGCDRCCGNCPCNGAAEAKAGEQPPSNTRDNHGTA